MRKRQIWKGAKEFVRKIRWWEKVTWRLSQGALRQKLISERGARRVLKMTERTWNEIEAVRAWKQNKSRYHQNENSGIRRLKERNSSPKIAS